MTQYVLTNAGRLLKFEDGLAVAELSRGFWTPSKDDDSQDGVYKRFTESEVMKFTCIPGKVITKDNVGPLWDFTDGVANLASSLFGCLKGYLSRNVVNGPLLPELNEGVLMECLAASYLLNKAVTSASGSEPFDKLVDSTFLDYYVYQIQMTLGGGVIAHREEFVELLLSCLNDYEDAARDESRVEKIFIGAWKNSTKTSFKDRVLLCLCSRAYLRTKDIPENKLSGKKGKEIPDFNAQDSKDYLEFSLALLKVAAAWLPKELPDELPLDGGHQA